MPPRTLRVIEQDQIRDDQDIIIGLQAIGVLDREVVHLEGYPKQKDLLNAAPLRCQEHNWTFHVADTSINLALFWCKTDAQRRQVQRRIDTLPRCLWLAIESNFPTLALAFDFQGDMQTEISRAVVQYGLQENQIYRLSENAMQRLALFGGAGYLIAGDPLPNRWLELAPHTLDPFGRLYNRLFELIDSEPYSLEQGNTMFLETLPIPYFTD